MSKYSKLVKESMGADRDKANRLSRRNKPAPFPSSISDHDSLEETTTTETSSSPSSSSSSPVEKKATTTTLDDDDDDRLEDLVESEAADEKDNLPHIADEALLRHEHLSSSKAVDDEEEEEEGGGKRERVFRCDLCSQQYRRYSELETHVLEAHPLEVGSDFSKLREVSQSLSPHWRSGALQARLAEKNKQWGKQIFDIFARRDGGAKKLEEAHAARQQLQFIVQQWNPTAEVFMFGSSVAFGVWDGIADIDFAVVDVEMQKKGLWPPMEKSAVRSITEILRRVGFSFYHLEPIAHARVPIIKHHAATPIRLPDAWRVEAKDRIAALHSPSSPEMEKTKSPETQLEAELVLSRSIQIQLSTAASPVDRILVEASVRQHLGSEHVLQCWWNRRGDTCFMVCSSTTKAVQATSTPFLLSSPQDATTLTTRNSNNNNNYNNNKSPPIRVTPLHEECRPELFHIDFDLSFRAFGIRNSLLLRRYLTSHPCVRPGAMVLKDWSKTSKVNNSVNGYLTSYAINILWIYYLVHKKVIDYIDPIEDITDELNGPSSCPQDPPYVPLLPETSNNNNGARVEDYYQQAGELLMGFFHFYAAEFDWERHVVSLNRRGLTTKRQLHWDSDVTTSTPLRHGRLSHQTTRYNFCIEDPYEENLNLGRHMGVTKTLRVQKEFHKALLSLIKEDGRESCVFQRSSATTPTNTTEEVPTLETLLRSDTSDPSNSNSSSLQQMDRLLSKDVFSRWMVNSNPITSARPPIDSSLALRAQYALLCLTLNTLALARLQPPSSSSSSFSFARGVPEGELKKVFTTYAPLSYALVSKAWRWEQLIHRLGFSLHPTRPRSGPSTTITTAEEETASPGERWVCFRREIGVIDSPSASSSRHHHHSPLSSSQEGKVEAFPEATTVAEGEEVHCTPEELQAVVQQQQQLLLSSEDLILQRWMEENHMLKPHSVQWRWPSATAAVFAPPSAFNVGDVSDVGPLRGSKPLKYRYDFSMHERWSSRALLRWGLRRK